MDTGTPTEPALLRVSRLGRVDYSTAWRHMQEFTAARDDTTTDELWFLEHEPVFTIGLNGRREHVFDTGNIPLLQTDRGGQATYHGPGQLIAYVLLDIARRRLGVVELVRLLEQSVIDLAADLGIAAARRPGAPGVYVAGRKLAALGLRVKRGRCYHGLALNVAMELEPFQRINPCGHTGLEVTQLDALGADLTVAATASRLQRHLQSLLGYTVGLDNSRQAS